ncbi:porin [Taklimakanibacter deserti]|uniref:porin n=1 Tax=Taklimakanibacter deserti TaxID=2267839 RepID=UPI0013C50CA0
MKGLSRLLLGSAALVWVAGLARADELSSLKAEIESLQSRISRLEAQPQASVPAGYSLLSIRGGQTYIEYSRPGKKDDVIPEDSGFTLSVVPAADAAPTAEVSVSAELRTALLYTDFENDDNADIALRARLVVQGKTDTAVGEVGGYFRLKAEGGGDLSDYSEEIEMQRAFGWWKFAPNWQLLAGQEDATATLVTSWDFYAATAPTRSFGPSDAYNEQMRLTYTRDAWSFALALEDPDYDTDTVTFLVLSEPGPVLTEQTENDAKNDIPSVQGYALYSGDGFTGQVVGLWQSDKDGADDWAAGGGVVIGLGEGFDLFGAAVIGEGTSVYANNLAPLSTDDEFWAGSAGILASLTEETRIELGIGYEDYEEAGEALGVGGGIYWSPVAIVTLGAGVTYVDFNDAFVNDEPTDDNSLQVFFGVWLKGLKYQ